MARGSSSPGSPGVGGAIKDAVDAIRTTFGPTNDGTPPVGKGGAEREQAISNEVDSIAGDASNHSSTVASNAGPQAQSSDHYNKY